MGDEEKTWSGRKQATYQEGETVVGAQAAETPEPIQPVRRCRPAANHAAQPAASHRDSGAGGERSTGRSRASLLSRRPWSEFRQTCRFRARLYCTKVVRQAAASFMRPDPWPIAGRP